MFSAKTTGPIFTKILHDIVALVASSSKMKPCPTGERAKNECISLPSLRQYHLVAMATSLDKLENIDPSLAHKARSYGEKIAKISPVNPEIFNEIR